MGEKTTIRGEEHESESRDYFFKNFIRDVSASQELMVQYVDKVSFSSSSLSGRVTPKAPPGDTFSSVYMGFLFRAPLGLEAKLLFAPPAPS